MAVTVENAWTEGYNAGCEREPETANPYSGKLWHSWLDGWREGSNPDREEREREHA